MSVGVFKRIDWLLWLDRCAPVFFFSVQLGTAAAGWYYVAEGSLHLAAIYFVLSFSVCNNRRLALRVDHLEAQASELVASAARRQPCRREVLQPEIVHMRSSLS